MKIFKSNEFFSYTWRKVFDYIFPLSLSVCLNFNELISECSKVTTPLILCRLYCEAKDSEYRLSCRKVCFYILETILRALAPITPHLVEEVQTYHPVFSKSKTTFKINENFKII